MTIYWWGKVFCDIYRCHKEMAGGSCLEYESLLENETWELVELLKDRNAIESRWVFKVKHQSDRQVERPNHEIEQLKLILKTHTSR